MNETDTPTASEDGQSKGIESSDLLACARCGEKRPKEEMLMHKVRRYHTQKHLEKVLPYCKEKGCAGYEQMAMEC